MPQITHATYTFERVTEEGESLDVTWYLWGVVDHDRYLRESWVEDLRVEDASGVTVDVATARPEALPDIFDILVDAELRDS